MANAVVILQSDPARARRLAAGMKAVADKVMTVRSLAELRRIVTSSPIRAAVLDMDMLTVQDITSLRRQLGIQVVCTHHAPDDAMWTAVLGAGALDCCFDGDAPSICRAIKLSPAA